MITVCCTLADHQAGFEGEGEHLAQRVDLRFDPADVVGHVAEMRAHDRIDRKQIGMLEPAADLDQRARGVAQAQQIAPQQIEPVDVLGGEALHQHAVLDALDLVGDRIQHRRVIVDDKIEDGVEDIVLALAERLGSRLAAFAHRA